MLKNLAYLFCLVFFISCTYKGEQKIDNATSIEFFELNEKNPKVQMGDELSIHFRQYADEKLAVDNFDRPAIKVIASPAKFEGDFMAGLLQMHEGDSVKISVDNELHFNNSGLDMPEQIKGTKKMYYFVKLEKIVPAKEVEIRNRKIQGHQIKKDVELITAYLDSNKIPHEATRDLLFFSKEVKNENGKRLKLGEKVWIHAKGELMNGTIIDNTFDQNTPYEIILGETNLIYGLQLGLGYMKTGEKFTFYIPSYLAYGGRLVDMTEKGIKIPANSILKYQIEILENK